MQGKPQKNWLERNWKWLVAISLLGIIGLFVAFVLAILLIVTSAAKSSDAYALAMSTARSSPELTAALGEPIEAGFFVTGNISVSGPSGRAELSIPLKGPKAAATLYVNARKSAGKWTIKELIAETDPGGQRLVLAGKDCGTAKPLQEPDHE